MSPGYGRLLPDYPDWPEWQRAVRGRTAVKRLDAADQIVPDTSVLIAHLRGDEAATRYLLDIQTGERSLQASLASSRDQGGMRSGERRSAASLFSILTLLPVTDIVVRRAGEFLRTAPMLYRHQGIDLVDYAVAATVHLHRATLATLTVQHFPMFKGLQPPF